MYYVKTVNLFQQSLKQIFDCGTRTSVADAFMKNIFT